MPRSSTQGDARVHRCACAALSSSPSDGLQQPTSRMATSSAVLTMKSTSIRSLVCPAEDQPACAGGRPAERGGACRVRWLPTVAGRSPRRGVATCATGGGGHRLAASHHGRRGAGTGSRRRPGRRRARPVPDPGLVVMGQAIRPGRATDAGRRSSPGRPGWLSSRPSEGARRLPAAARRAALPSGARRGAVRRGAVAGRFADATTASRPRRRRRRDALDEARTGRPQPRVHDAQLGAGAACPSSPVRAIVTASTIGSRPGTRGRRWSRRPAPCRAPLGLGRSSRAGPSGTRHGQRAARSLRSLGAPSARARSISTLAVGELGWKQHGPDHQGDATNPPTSRVP